MKRNLVRALVLAAMVVVSVGSYNIWSYCDGRCSSRTFFTLGPPGLILLAGISLAVTALLVLKFRRLSCYYRNHCRCGQALGQSWKFCSACGQSRPRTSA